MAAMSAAAMEQAAAAVRRSYRDEEAYVLLPDTSDRHFLAESVLIGLGGVLVAAFVKGVSASLEGRAEQWGKDVGNWIADRAEALLTSEKPSVSTDLEPALAEAPKAPQESDVRLAEDLLANALISRGMTKQVAHSAAAAAAVEGKRLIDSAAA